MQGGARQRGFRFRQGSGRCVVGFGDLAQIVGGLHGGDCWNYFARFKAHFERLGLGSPVERALAFDKTPVLGMRAVRGEFAICWIHGRELVIPA